MSRLVASPRRLYAAVTAAVLLVVLGVNALDPAPATAGPFGVDLGPVDDFTEGVKDFAVTAGKAAATGGASLLEDALEWLLGGFEAVITVWLVKFLVHIHVPLGGQLQDTIAPLIVVGGFFLVVGMLASVANGYREVIAGTDTAARVIGQAIFRVVGLALLMAAWPWVVPLAVEAANGMTSYILSDTAVAEALRQTYASGKLNPILWLLAVIFMAIAMLILIVMKFVIAIAFACLFVGGPALIGFGALPGVGPAALSMVTRGLVTLMAIPLAWTVVFVAWASVSGGMFDAFEGGGLVAAWMGPGLFIAGLVIMLAVTKKLLSMANFGLHAGVPGAGIARLVAARAALGAAGTAASGAKGGSQGAAAPIKGGDGAPIRGAGFEKSAGQQGGATTPQPADGAATKEKRPGKDLGGGHQAASPHPERARAQREETERNEAAWDQQGVTATRKGVWRHRDRVPESSRQQLAQHTAQLRESHGDNMPRASLRKHAGALSSSDRSGAVHSARAALEESPEHAQDHYTRSVHNATAGQTRSPEEFEGATWLAAAPPQTVIDEFGKSDGDKFTWRQPETGEGPGPYDHRHKKPYGDYSMRRGGGGSQRHGSGE
jgi:hypothetical protein